MKAGHYEMKRVSLLELGLFELSDATFVALLVAQHGGRGDILPELLYFCCLGMAAVALAGLFGECVVTQHLPKLHPFIQLFITRYKALHTFMQPTEW